MGFLGGIDVAIILGSLALVVLVGLWASRHQEGTARGYFLASGKLPWYIIGAAFVSTSVSSEQIVGTVGKAYESGMGVANWEWFALPCYALVIVFFIPIYLKNRVTTVPDLLSRRFAPVCGAIYSWVMLFAYVVVFMVPVLYGGSLAFSALTGWPFHLVLWVTVALIAAYAVKGGLRSVMFTDALQCLFLMGGGILLFFIALGKIPGGWSAMEAARPERMRLYRPPGDPTAPFLGILAACSGVFLFYQSSNQVMIQRVLGARSTWDGMMGIIFAGFINLLRPLVTCFLGLIVYHWTDVLHNASPLADKDTTFPFALQEFAPGWGLRGIILAGFIAAVMSATSPLANSTATIFSMDVYRRLRPDASEGRLILVGRIASAASLGIAALIAPSVSALGGIFQYFQTGVTYLATPFISVVLLGIFWKRANHQAALFGLIGGFLIQIALGVGIPKAGIELHWLYVAFFAQMVILAGMVAVALATPPPPRERWEPFVWRPAMLAEYDEGIARPWYRSLKLWFAVYAAIWLYLYWRFW
jgi:solute:Na+ symporter, SSS family